MRARGTRLRPAVLLAFGGLIAGLGAAASGAAASGAATSALRGSEEASGALEKEDTMETGDRRWAAFEMEALEDRLDKTPGPWLEFLRVPALSAGVYEVAAGGKDTQSPHDRDELYYIVRGRGRFSVDGEDMAVAAGTVLFVKAEVEHRFHSVTEDLTVLVFFAGSLE